MLKGCSIYVILLFVIQMFFSNEIEACELNRHIIDVDSISNKSIEKRKNKRRKDKKLEETAIDTTKSKLPFDKLEGIDKVIYLVDSLRTAGVTVDSVTIDSLARHYFTDTIVVRKGVMPKLNADGSLSNARILDSLIYAEKLELGKKDKKKDRINIFRDSVSFGRLSTLSIVLPGYGQIYNKQYWKLPVLYGSVAALTFTGAVMGNKSNDYKELFNQSIAEGNQPNVDKNYAKYRDYKTASTLFYVSAGLSYMYFMADAAFNYEGIEDSKNRATYLAFMFPGAGQIYNKQYWKLPIVYAGFATFAYIINFNGRGYTRYNNAYLAVLKGEPDEFEGRLTEEVLRNTKNNFRRARDMSIFYTIGFYLLTVVDAYVSASFKQYDISDDLSLNVAPSINLLNNRGFAGGKPVSGSYGMSLFITF